MGISLYSYYIRSKGKKKVTALFSLPSFVPVSTLRFLDPFFASTWPACLLVKCCFALISSSLRYLFDIFSLTIIVRNYKYTFGERKGREGKKKKRSGRDRWDGVLNRNRPPPQISGLYQGRGPVFEEISTAIRCKWVEAKNERLFDQLRDDPISWQRAVRPVSGDETDRDVSSSLLCPPWNINRPPITIPLWNQYRHPRKTNSLALYSRAESLLFRIHRNPWSLISSSISLFVSSSLLLLREANGRNDDWF